MHSMWMIRFHLFVQFPHTRAHAGTHYSLAHLIFMLSEFMMQQITEFYCFFTYCTQLVRRYCCLKEDDGTRQIPTQKRRNERTNTVAMPLHAKLCAAVCLSSWFLINSLSRTGISHCRLCSMFFSLTKCSNSNQPNLPNRVDTNNITFRHAIHFSVCACAFFRLVTLNPIRIVSHASHPCIHMCECKSVPFSSKCRFAF